MPRLAGKIAWITGAGSGIGEAAALALAEEGATTVLTGRTQEKLERVAARIRQQGGEAYVQPAELTDSKLVQKVGGAEAIGPILVGMKRPVHVLHNGCDVHDIVNMTAIAVVDAQVAEEAAS